MRIATSLLAACVVATVFGQDLIEWSSERKLMKSDFRGRVPAHAANTSLSWLKIDASWECEGGKLFATARATFDPSRSWWRAVGGDVWQSAGERASGASRTQVDARRSMVQRDVQLLQHEQLHFDLAEIAVRRIRSRFDDLSDACDAAGGTEAIQQAVVQIDRELEDEQRRYDRETNHGVNPVAQDQWRRRIALLLRSQTTTPPRPQ